MATLALTAVGTYYGGPVGGAIGSLVGQAIDQKLFGSKGAGGETVFGPRVTDAQVQTATYGTTIARVGGTRRLAGNIVWAGPLVEHRHRSQQERGGKGGQETASESEIVTFTYSRSWAVALCRGPISGVRRIWGDGKLMYDAGDGDIAAVLAHNERAGSFGIYLGDEGQEADPIIEAAQGAGNVPAFRGLAYIVFDDLSLTNFAGRIPNITAEVIAALDETWVKKATNARFTFDDDPAAVGTFAPGGGNGGNMICNGRIVEGMAWHGEICHIDGDSWEYRRAISVVGQALQEDLFRFDMPAAWAMTGSGAFGRVLSYVRSDQPAIVSYVSARPTELVYIEPLALRFYRIAMPAGFTFTQNLPGMALREGNHLYVTVSYAAAGGNAGVIYCNLGDARPDGSGQAGAITRRVNAELLVDLADDATWYDIAFIAADDAHWYLINATANPGQAGIEKRAHGSADLVETILAAGTWSHPRGAHVSADGVLYILEGDGNLARIEDGVETSVASGVEADASGNQSWASFADRLVVASESDDYDQIETFWYSGAMDPTSGVTAGSIVSTLLQDAGIEAGDIDVAELSTTVVGFLVATSMSVRDAVMPVLRAVHADALESAGTFKTVVRGGAVVAAIAETDLAPAAGQGGRLSWTRSQEVELPREVAVRYADPALDYEINVQRHLIENGLAENNQTVELPLALNADHAKQICEVIAHEAYVGRTSYAATTHWGHADLEPADVVTIAGDGETVEVRLAQISSGGAGPMEIKAEEHDAGVYAVYGSGALPQVEIAQQVSGQGPTQLFLLNLPLLRDADPDAGWYLLAGGWLDGWRGALVEQSFDAGETWTELAVVAGSCTWGLATDVLADSNPGGFDRGSTVNVRLNAGTLSSASSRAALLNGANVALLGDEVLQFETATLEGDGTYTLSVLLRARRGSDWATSTHRAGERFVLLASDDVYGFSYPLDALGRTRLVRARPAVSSAVGSYPLYTFTPNGESLRPYAPVRVTGTRNGSDDLTIDWLRRTRRGGGLTDGGDVPVGETFEAYEVDVLDGGGAVVRTLTANQSEASYSAADQTTDFGAPQASVDVVVYQLSAVAAVGRGHGTPASV